MAAQLPEANFQQEKQQEQHEAVAGGVAAGCELAGQIWKEVGAAAAAGALNGALANRINFQEVPLNQAGKTGLNTGAMLNRYEGQTHLGTPQFSINPPVGWHMQFDKHGKLVDAQGVKKIGSEHGITTFMTSDGQTVVIDKHGPLKIKDGKGNITSFSRPADAGLKLPKVELNGKAVEGRVPAARPGDGKEPPVKQGEAKEPPVKPGDAKQPPVKPGELKPVGENKQEKGGAMEPQKQSYETPFEGHNGRGAVMKDGTMFRQYLDGTVVLHSNDGSRTKLTPNGLLLITEGGKTREYNLKDVQPVMYKDGGSLGYTFPDGTHVIMKHRIAGDGKFDDGVVIRRPNGQSIETYSHMSTHVDYTPATQVGLGKKVIRK